MSQQSTLTPKRPPHPILAAAAAWFTLLVAASAQAAPPSAGTLIRCSYSEGTATDSTPREILIEHRPGSVRGGFTDSRGNPRLGPVGHDFENNAFGGNSVYTFKVTTRSLVSIDMDGTESAWMDLTLPPRTCESNRVWLFLPKDPRDAATVRVRHDSYYCGGLSFLESNPDMNPLNERAHTVNDNTYDARCELTAL